MTRNVQFQKRLMLFVGAILIAGCGWYGDPPDDHGPQAVAQQPVANPVSIAVADHSEIVRRIASHRGRVVILDCWSTSCPPCVKEFPGLVDLKKDYGDTVSCLSLSFDFEGFGVPEDVLEPVRKFLEQVSAGDIENLLNSDEADALYKKMNITSVPAVMVWDRNGTLIQQFDDEYASEKLGRTFTYDDVRRAVDQALSSQSKE